MIFIIKGFLDYCLYCYFHNVSADMSSGLLQVFVELGNHISINQVQVLSISVLLLTCSQDWTCNLQKIDSLEALGNQCL